MTTVETLKEKVKRLKTKLSGKKSKSDAALLRACTKTLKRAQRKIRLMSGAKLAAKQKGEEGEAKKEGAPASAEATAGKPAEAPVKATPAPKAEAKPETKPAAAEPKAETKPAEEKK
ncbi:MAG: hypothetical protein HY762_01680 [Planctomycetes bacterium]|nr:hypothetical protein [Planctomycetota bacterium]